MDRNLYRSMALVVAMFILAFATGTASAQHASKNKSDNPNQKDTFRNMSADELKQLEAAMAPALLHRHGTVRYGDGTIRLVVGRRRSI